MKHVQCPNPHWSFPNTKHWHWEATSRTNTGKRPLHLSSRDKWLTLMESRRWRLFRRKAVQWWNILVCRLKCPASQPPLYGCSSGERVQFHQRGQAASIKLAQTLKSFSRHSRRVVARKESLRIPATQSWGSRKSRHFTKLSASIWSKADTCLFAGVDWVSGQDSVTHPNQARFSRHTLSSRSKS